MRRSVLGVLLAVFAIGSVSAQATVPRLVQSSDGTLYVIAGDTRHRVVPAPITDEELLAIAEAAPWEDGTLALAVPPPSAPVPPAAPDPPAPPPAPTGSGKRIGETTVLTSPSGARIAVTVNAFEDNLTSNSRYDQPEGRFAVADWTIKNEGTTEVRLNRLHFKLQTADGFVIERSGDTIREPDLETDVLGPGQIVRGWLTYDIPIGQRITSLIYQPPGARQFVVAELP